MALGKSSAIHLKNLPVPQISIGMNRAGGDHLTPLGNGPPKTFTTHRVELTQYIIRQQDRLDFHTTAKPVGLR